MRRPSFIASVAAVLGGCTHRARLSSSSETPNRGMMQGGMMHGMMGSGGMMNVSDRDMSIYMEMFNRHTEIRRHVEQLPNGIRTVTESEDAHIVALLQEHVPGMWAHVNAGEEVRCMSNSLPTMFRNAKKYRRDLTVTPKGVAVTETSDDPVVLAAIRRHAEEVTGFVTEGMPAMMRGMMRQ
jgi:hypothetical protein